jgi:hypothetical protein
MNETMWGAIIGAIGSILGGFLATLFNIWRHRTTEDEKEKRQIKISSSIIYTDFYGLLKEMIYYSKNNTYQGFGSHNAYHSNHIATLESKLDSNEMHSIHQLYGVLIRYQRSTMLDTLNSTEQKSHLQNDFSRFCTLVYGSMEDFKRNVDNINIDNLDHELITRNMLPRFKEIMNKLKDLKQ